MSSPLTRYENTVATTANLADLGLSPLASSVVASGATAFVDGYRVRLGAVISPSPRTTTAPIAVSSASTVRDRIRARAEEIRNSGTPPASPAETTDALIVAMRQRLARLSGTDDAPVTAPDATTDGDAALAALLRNPPEPEDVLIAALERDAAKGSAK